MPCGFFPLCHDVVISPLKPASSLEIAAGLYLSSCVVVVICVVIRSCLITSLHINTEGSACFCNTSEQTLKLNPFLMERAGSRGDLCGTGLCAAPFHCSGLDVHVCSCGTAAVRDIFHGLGAFTPQGSYGLHLLIIFILFLNSSRKSTWGTHNPKLFASRT